LSTRLKQERQGKEKRKGKQDEVWQVLEKQSGWKVGCVLFGLQKVEEIVV
jgi:hypothetical protein